MADECAIPRPGKVAARRAVCRPSVVLCYRDVSFFSKDVQHAQLCMSPTRLVKKCFRSTAWLCWRSVLAPVLEWTRMAIIHSNTGRRHVQVTFRAETSSVLTTIRGRRLATADDWHSNNCWEILTVWLTSTGSHVAGKTELRRLLLRFFGSS